MLPTKLSLTVAGSMIDLLFSLFSAGRRRLCIVPCDIGDRGNVSSSVGGEGSRCCSSKSATDRLARQGPAIFLSKALSRERGRISAVPTEKVLLRLELLGTIIGRCASAGTDLGRDMARKDDTRRPDKAESPLRRNSSTGRQACKVGSW